MNWCLIWKARPSHTFSWIASIVSSQPTRPTGQNATSHRILSGAPASRSLTTSTSPAIKPENRAQWRSASPLASGNESSICITHLPVRSTRISSLLRSTTRRVRLHISLKNLSLSRSHARLPVTTNSLGAHLPLPTCWKWCHVSRRLKQPFF